MRICNWLNSAIVSQMLKKHKKIEIMTYITDNQSFTFPMQISCQTLSLRIRIFRIREFFPIPRIPSEGSPWDLWGKTQNFIKPQSAQSAAKDSDLNTCQRHPFGINTSTHFKLNPYNYDD